LNLVAMKAEEHISLIILLQHP